MLIFGVILTIAGLAILTSVLYLRRERALQRFEWQRVDIGAMTRLFDRDDDHFLAEHLSPAVVFRLRIKRALAAQAYLRVLLQDARYAMAVAKASREPDPELVAAAAALQVEVAKLRVKAWFAIVAPVFIDVAKIESVFRSSDPRKPIEMKAR